MQIDDRRFFVVHSWMITKLKLKSLERDIFAIIYGFSQNPEARCFDSLNYLAGLTGYSKRSVVTALDNLLSKNLIFKQQENVAGITRNRYYHNDELVQRILTGEISIVDTLPEEFSGEIISPVSEVASPVSGEIISPVSEVASPKNIIKDNIENKNIVTPVPPAPPKNHNRLYNEKRKTLSDDLKSQEEIQKQTRERKKQSVEDKCLAEIDKRQLFSGEVRELLRQYFDWNYHSQNPKKIKQLLDWRQKLDRLEQLVKKGEDAEKVIRQSIDNQWYGFFEYKEQTQASEKHECFADEINPDHLTLEERQAIYDERKKLVAEGKLKTY